MRNVDGVLKQQTYGTINDENNRRQIELLAISTTRDEGDAINESSHLLAAPKRRVYIGEDGAVAAYNNVLNNNIIRTLQGDYSKSLTFKEVAGQIWADKAFTAQLNASVGLGVVTAYFYYPSALCAAEFLGQEIPWLTVILKIWMVSSGCGLNAALGALSIKKLIDMVRQKLSPEEAFLTGQINLTILEKGLNNAKNITDIAFALAASIAPIYLGTVGVANLVLKIAGIISGATNFGPNWLGMNSVTYPNPLKKSLRKAQLAETQYLKEQLQLFTEFPLKDLLAKIYLIKEELCDVEDDELSESDYLKLMLHLFQLGKKVDPVKKAILLKTYRDQADDKSKSVSTPLAKTLLTGVLLSDKMKADDSSKPLLIEISPPDAIDQAAADNNAPLLPETAEATTPAIEQIPRSPSQPSLEEDPEIIYKDPATFMKKLATNLLGLVSATSPMGYVLETKNGTDNYVKTNLHKNDVWPGFLTAVLALVPYTSLSLGAGLGMGEGMISDGKSLAALAYPKIRAALWWITVILGSGSGATNARANFNNSCFWSKTPAPATTAPATITPGTTNPAANSNSCTPAVCDSEYPLMSSIIRYGAGGLGLALCPITNIYYTLQLIDEILIYVARNCGNPEVRMILEFIIKTRDCIDLRQKTNLNHYESILNWTTTADNEMSPLISKMLRGIFAERLSEFDYFQPNNPVSVAKLVPQLAPRPGEVKACSVTKEVYTQSKCHSIFNPQTEGIRRRKNAGIRSEDGILGKTPAHLGPPV